MPARGLQGGRTPHPARRSGGGLLPPPLLHRPRKRVLLQHRTLPLAGVGERRPHHGALVEGRRHDSHQARHGLQRIAHAARQRFGRGADRTGLLRRRKPAPARNRRRRKLRGHPDPQRPVLGAAGPADHQQGRGPAAQDRRHPHRGRQHRGRRDEPHPHPPLRGRRCLRHEDPPQRRRRLGHLLLQRHRGCESLVVQRSGGRGLPPDRLPARRSDGVSRHGRPFAAQGQHGLRIPPERLRRDSRRPDHRQRLRRRPRRIQHRTQLCAGRFRRRERPQPHGGRRGPVVHPQRRHRLPLQHRAGPQGHMGRTGIRRRPELPQHALRI